MVPDRLFDVLPRTVAAGTDGRLTVGGLRARRCRGGVWHAGCAASPAAPTITSRRVHCFPHCRAASATARSVPRACADSTTRRLSIAPLDAKALTWSGACQALTVCVVRKLRVSTVGRGGRSRGGTGERLSVVDFRVRL